MDYPAHVRWDFARKQARKFSEPFTSPPIPVSEIAENNGVNIIFHDFAQHVDVVAGFCDFKAKKIYVNRSDRFSRQVFTIAHEFGHWVLHKKFFEENPAAYGVLPRFQTGEKNTFEKEANCFAAELLVPKHLLAPVKHASASRLADIFGVSREMMEFRLKNV